MEGPVQICDPFSESRTRSILPDIAYRKGLLPGMDRQNIMQTSHKSSLNRRIRPVQGVPALLDILITKFRQAANPACAYTNDIIPAGDIARVLDAHRHICDVTLRPGQSDSSFQAGSVQRADVYMQIQHPHERSLKDLVAAVNLPAHLILYMAYSFNCAECGIFVRSEQANDVVQKTILLARASSSVSSAPKQRYRAESGEILTRGRLCKTCQAPQR